MAAVWAVALLVVCSGVRSYGEEVQATITQVRLATTAEGKSTAAAAPAITTTTAGSGDTHSAVLSGNHLTTEGVPLVLVDLARADQEKMSSMSATPPSAAVDAVPEGFDMNEFSEDEAPAQTGDLVVPEGFDANEFSEDATPGSAGEGQGHVVTGFPSIPETDDKSFGSGYGVVAPQTVDDSPAGESFATAEDAAPGPVAADEGHEVTGFPTIPEGDDNTQGAGYGVVSPQTADETPETSESFSAYQGDEFSAASEGTPAGGGGHVVTGFPTIPETADNTHGAGYGVVAPQTADDTPGTGESFSSYAGDEFTVASEDTFAGDKGHVVTGFPTIPETTDNTHGAGYGVVAPQSFADGDSFGVQSFEGGVDADPEQSFAAAGGEDEGGFQVTGFPTEIGGEGSNFEAHGAAAGESFADFEGGQFSVQSAGGQQLEGFPELGSFSDDSSRGNAFGGVRPFGPFYGRP